MILKCSCGYAADAAEFNSIDISSSNGHGSIRIKIPVKNEPAIFQSIDLYSCTKCGNVLWRPTNTEREKEEEKRCVSIGNKPCYSLCTLEENMEDRVVHIENLSPEHCGLEDGIYRLKKEC